MREALGKIAGSILRSLFISIVMFVVVFSVITGEFPPRFSRLKNTYHNLQQMAQLSRQIHEQQKVLKKQYAQDGLVEDADLEALQEMNLRRAEIGAGILQGSAVAGVGSEENKELKERLQQLENQVYRLQQRVSELESERK
ncbi:hypothetical protein [Bdellovibrio bacteriovorus]|uniref:hypothetical protein n=1 Tax=Bdellovibrio bacteriovorus TaxID=959 RepID=UPI0035A5DC6A